jgi:subtilase family serine protease
MYRPSLFGRLWRPSARTVSFGAFVALSLACSALYAEVVSTVELSPLIAKSTLLGPVVATSEIGVTLSLPLSDPQGLAEFVRHVSTPGDPLFRQYLSPQQFAERFGSNAADYAYLKSWVAANGLRVSHESVGRFNLTVRGNVSQFEKLFSTQLNHYRSPDGEEFYSAGIQPIVPSEIAAKISGVIGLTESKMGAPMVKVAKKLGENPPSAAALMTPDTAGGTGPGGTYSPADLRNVYNIPTFGKLNPTAVAAVFEQGGYQQSDVTKFLTYNGLPQVTVTPISVDGSPITAIDPNIELEAVLDIDMIAGINPAISGVRVYIDASTWDPFATALLDAITQVGDDNVAKVFSISYGQDEGNQGKAALEAEHTALAQLASEGITVTASSGDDGAYGHEHFYPYNVEDPASQPYVTGVGGTTLLTGPGEAYVGETAWNDLASGYGATGGGISAYWRVPDFQSKIPIGGVTWVTANGGSAKFRNVPDISAVGDPLTGVGVYSKMNGGWVQVGGTSVSSPIWGGYLTIVNAGLNYVGLGNLGYFNPILYWVGTPVYGGGVVSDWLNRVLEGSNGYAPHGGYPGYSNGWDYCNTTGNGSLVGSLLATQLLVSGSQPGTAPAQFSHYAITTVTSNSAGFEWSPVTGAAGYELSVTAFGATDTQLYVTKGTNMTVKGLSPNTLYVAQVWAFNASGSSTVQFPYLTTPSKPKP